MYVNNNVHEKMTITIRQLFQKCTCIGIIVCSCIKCEQSNIANSDYKEVLSSILLWRALKKKYTRVY